MRAAHRAIRIFLQLELAEFHPERVVNQEPSHERLADAHDELDRFGRLNRADDAGQHAQDPSLGAARHQSGRRRLGIEAAIARAVLGREHRRLPFEPEDAAVRVRLAGEHARIVGEVTGRKIVGAVENHVVRLEQIERVLRRQRGFVRLDGDVRIQLEQTIFGRRELRSPDIGRAVDHLPLQVAEIDDIEVDDADRADAGRRQIQRRRRPEAARADAQHAALLELLLPFDAHLRHDEMPAVALDFVVRQGHLPTTRH